MAPQMPCVAEAEEAEKVRMHHIAIQSAGSGLSPKLYRDLCPEVRALHEEFDAIALAALAQGLDTDPTSICFVLLVGTRGQQGVEWLGPLLRQNLAACAADNLETLLAHTILPAFWKASEGKSHTWASHREGPNHPLLSGGYFLEACVKAGGFAGVRAAAASLRLHAGHVMAADRGAALELSSKPQLAILKAFASSGLVLGWRQDRPNVLSNYNGMDKGRVVIAWALHTNRASGIDDDISPEVFEYVALRQRGGFGALAPYGAASAAGFARLHRELRQHAMATVAVGDNRISWPFVFVHLCECKQTTSTLGAPVVAAALDAHALGATPSENIQRRVQRFLDVGVSGKCIMTQLVRMLVPRPARRLAATRAPRRLRGCGGALAGDLAALAADTAPATDDGAAAARLILLDEGTPAEPRAPKPVAHAGLAAGRAAEAAARARKMVCEYVHMFRTVGTK